MFAVVMPAAGSGTRFGGGDKLLVEIGGESVLRRSVGLFAQRTDVGQMVIVTGRERIEIYREHLTVEKLKRPQDFLVFVEGGRERWESVVCGLKAVRGDIRYVAIQDAARPLTPVEVIDAAFAGAVRVGGSVPVVAEPATLKRVGADGNVMETVSRAGLFQAQTPQCFERAKLAAAFEALGKRGELAGVTDDAQVFEKMGHAVAATMGSVVNLKITTAEDVRVAEGILRGTNEELRIKN